MDYISQDIKDYGDLEDKFVNDPKFKNLEKRLVGYLT